MQKVLLTEPQIEEICSSLPINRKLPEYVAKSIIFRIRTRLAEHLSTVRIYPCLYTQFRDEVVRAYWKTMCDSGTAVGIQASTSLGERQTQTTLNTFHAAGISVKTVVVGVPRFSELLNATRSPKMVNCLIFMNESFNNITEVRTRIGSALTYVDIRRLVNSYRVLRGGDFEAWHHLYAELFDMDLDDIHPDKWRVRFELNTEVMFEYKVNMRMIREAISRAYSDCFVFTTPDTVGVVEVWMERFVFTEVDMSAVAVGGGVVEGNDKENDKDEDTLPDELDETVEQELDDDDAMSTLEEDEESSSSASSSAISIPVPLIPPSAQDELEPIPFDIHRKIHMENKVVHHLMQVPVSGIENIQDVFFEKRKDEWIIATEGSNLYGLFSLPIVDKTRTICNNMWEIYAVLGIEAARQFLIEEYTDVVSSDGSYVNSSHIELLVDVMVYTGTIIAISRYGLKKVNCGPLAKASFEESVDNFLKAGLNSEKESTNSVSASIMLGKPPKTGTGVFDLMVDVDALHRAFRQPLPSSLPSTTTTTASSSSSSAADVFASSSSFVKRKSANTFKSDSVVEVNQSSSVREPTAPKKMSNFMKKRSSDGMSNTTASAASALSSSGGKASKLSKTTAASAKTTEFSQKNAFFDDE